MRGHRGGSPWRRWMLLGMVALTMFAALVVQGFVRAQIGTSGLRAVEAGRVDRRLADAGPYLDLVGDDGGSAVRSWRPAPGTAVLTFDDGPDPRWTPALLDLLAARDVHATFFVTGENVAEHPGLLRRILAEGHEVGAHTFTHADITSISDWRLDRELDLTQAAIAGATGRTAGIFRPPYIGRTYEIGAGALPAARRVAADGYLLVLSDLDGKDWRPGESSDDIVARATPDDGEGAVILLHDAGGDRSATLEATERLLDALDDEGYRFTTVSGSMGLDEQASVGAASSSLERRGLALIWALRLSGWALRAVSALALALAGLLLLRTVVSVAVALRHAWRPWTFVWLDPPPVTVVVPAYNEAAGIEAAVRSIAGSRYPTVEVIVVDDGSTDDTAAIVRSLGLENVRLITKENAGKPSALNRGILEASHDIIVTVDGDTLFERNTLFWLVQQLADPAVGAVAGNTKVANRRGVLGRWQHLEYTIGFNLDRRVADLFDCMATVPGAIGAFRRSALIDVGLFTDDTLAEDTDITIALNRAGWYIVYEERAVAWTEAPASIRALWRQRYRWSFGTMQALWKHRRAVRDRGTGRFGRRGLPYLLVFQVLLPLLGPLVDVFAVYGLLFLEPRMVVAWWGAFTVVQIATAACALRLDGERLRDLWALPLQLVVYRQLMYLVIVQSLASAVAGTRLRWQRMERIGVGTMAADTGAATIDLDAPSSAAGVDAR